MCLRYFRKEGKAMLIDFSVDNFLSFRETSTLSMERITRLREEQRDKSNIFSVPETKSELLKSAVIYGANASGKSNLLAAMHFSVHFVCDSAHRYQIGDSIPVVPFLFSEDCKTKPSGFEFRFYLSGSLFRYGFQVTQKQVKSEWLYRDEKMLFVRDEDKIEPSDSFTENSLILKTRDNGLFLSTCAQFNEPIATKILMNFFYRINFLMGASPLGTLPISIEMYKKPVLREKMLRLLHVAGTSIKDIHTEIDEEKVDENDPRREVFSHRDFGNDNLTLRTLKKITTTHSVGDHSYELDFELESAGTQKMFSLSGPFLDTLAEGKILVVDELDANLHPILVKYLIGLFHQGNHNYAQLIFATHNANLLNSELFRRDQIWFTEKNHDEATEIYSLADYRLDNGGKVRQDASYEKDYLHGRYGAIPFLANYEACEIE